MELRMLSGLHRGAVLELGEDAIALGASHEADVILADPGVADIHLRIIRQGLAYQLYPAGGKVFREDGVALEEAVEIERGKCFRVGEVWIGIFDAEDPWPESLPTPGPVPAQKQFSAMWRVRLKNAWREIRKSRTKMIGAAAVVVGLLLMCVWIGILVYVGRQNQELYEKETADTGTEIFGLGADGTEKPGSREKLMSELRYMLAERDLLERLDIVIGEDVWDIRGALDIDEQGRLERALAAFNKKHQPPFGLRASVVPVRDMLPFKVVQVTVGKYSSVVTDNGRRLFVGDVLDGYKLVSVDKTKLVFVGRLRIEFAW